MSINASMACVFFVGAKREGVLCATLVIKGVGSKQPFADLVGRLQPEGGRCRTCEATTSGFEKKTGLEDWGIMALEQCSPHRANARERYWIRKVTPNLNIRDTPNLNTPESGNYSSGEALWMRTPTAGPSKKRLVP